MSDGSRQEATRVRDWYNLVADAFIRRYEGESGWYLARCEEDLLHAVCRFDGRDVLDLGTGGGRLLPRLTQNARRVVGVDISESLLARAVRPPGVALLQMDAFDLAFRPSSFDTVVSLGLCEYIADFSPLLREIHRVLRPGGEVALTYHQIALYRRAPTDRPEAPYFGLTVGERTEYWSKRRHVRRTVRAVLSRAGFQKIRTYRVFFRIPQLVHALSTQLSARSGLAEWIRAAVPILERGLGRSVRPLTQFSTGNVFVVAERTRDV